MKKKTLLLKTLLFFVGLQFILAGCANYYKVISKPVENNSQKAAAIDTLKKDGRIFFLRDGNTAFFINNPIINVEQNKIECTLDSLSSMNKFHLALGRKGKMQYKKIKPAEKAVLNEAHLYVDPGTNAALGKYSISLESINKIELIVKDKRKTTNSYILGGIGIVLVTALATMIIFIATFKGIE